jgi:periplasmic copper chaperone A
MKNFAVCLLVVCAFGISALGQAHEYYAKNFKVIHPWGEPSRPADTEAKIYLSFEDMQGNDVLLRASSAISESVEFRTMVAGKEKAMKELLVEKADKLEWFPGKTYLVLKGLKAPLDLARSYPITLYFKNAGPVSVMISVGAH